MGSLSGAKEALRRELLARRKRIENREEKDEAVYRHIVGMQSYQKARRIFLYLSMPQEVDTWRLLRRALEEGKEVYAPCCEEDGKTMVFRRVFSPGGLQKGKFGIFQPHPASAPEPCGEAETFCLVPGVAFDRQGYRMGYGKGYYDRFLAGKSMETAGLCYEELLCLQLPREPHDQRVRSLVTEKGIFSC